MVHYEPVKVTIDTPGQAEVIFFLWIIIRYIPEGSKKNLAKESELRRWYTGSYEDIVDAKRSHMDNDRFNIILHEFPPEFNCLKELAKELRMASSPIQRGALFRGTWSDPKKVYIPMVDAFDKAILKISGENGWGKFA